MTKMQDHPVACSIPKIVKIRNADGKKVKIVAFPAYLFEVVELLKEDKIQTE